MYVEPPPGWFTFGTHVNEPGVELEFSVELDDEFFPLWERPINE